MGLTILGLETSCDETAASVVRRDEDGRVEVLSSIVGTQFEQHAPFGGVVPEIAARAHVEAIDASPPRRCARRGSASTPWTAWPPRPGRAWSAG
jgi:tRNA A37 threonylcarbamoyltransferase TsaD